MKKEDVFEFLQLIKYVEVLPMKDCDTELKEIVGFCTVNKLLVQTPDRNYILSDKGWALINKKFEWDDKAFAFSQPPSKKETLLYWGAGVLASGLLIYDIVANRLME